MDDFSSIVRNFILIFTLCTLLTHKLLFLDVHVQQRRGRKCFTTIAGIPAEFDYEKIMKYWKKVNELSQLNVLVLINLHVFLSGWTATELLLTRMVWELSSSMVIIDKKSSNSSAKKASQEQTILEFMVFEFKRKRVITKLAQAAGTTKAIAAVAISIKVFFLFIQNL